MQKLSSFGFLILIAASLPATLDAAAPASEARIERALVSLIDDVQVSAQQEGLLDQLHERRGKHISEGDLLAEIDKTMAEVQLLAATIQYEAAMAQANDDIDVRYAEAAANVADAELREKEEANRRVPGTVTVAELRRLELTRQRSVLQIDKSKMELNVAQMNAKVHSAEVEVAQNNLEQRKILSPVNGIIAATYFQKGEWVNAGDVVARVVRMDTLQVEGFLNANEFNPHEIADRLVTVEIQLAGGQSLSVQGRIVFVSPLIQAGGKFRVSAEVENRREGGQWILNPGTGAAMTIHLEGKTQPRGGRSR